MPVSKILAAIQEQTGNKIIDGRREAGVEDDRQIKVQFSKTPFWKALDRVLDDSGLTLYPYAEQKAVKVMPKTRAVRPRSQRASYSGPLRFEPIALLAQSDLRDPTGDSLRIRVEVSWEPRIAPVNLQLKISDLKVSDGEGKPIKLEEKEANLEIPVEPESNTKELVIPLSLPPRHPTDRPAHGNAHGVGTRQGRDFPLRRSGEGQEGGETGRGRHRDA